jgi:mRNA interferase HigB
LLLRISRSILEMERNLHVISRKKLREAQEEHHGLNLDPWYRTAKASKWKNLQEVRQSYSSADGVPVGERVYTVFNIAGNNFRLVTEIYYEQQTILVRHVLTHSEYDKGDWKQ